MARQTPAHSPWDCSAHLHRTSSPSTSATGTMEKTDKIHYQRKQMHLVKFVWVTAGVEATALVFFFLFRSLKHLTSLVLCTEIPTKWKQHVLWCRKVTTYIQLASFPGSSAWAERKEPGTHCLCIPRISGNLEISVKSAPLHQPGVPTSPV